ncbi:MAG: hypothetical protein ACXU8N_04850, partial [Telluria sp.]
STYKGQSGILMHVHSAGLLENWGFGDFQFLKSSPDEPQQPIETSQLVGWAFGILGDARLVFAGLPVSIAVGFFAWQRLPQVLKQQNR